MESNSVPGRIQISQETANELIAKGKEHWFVARADKIQAKVRDNGGFSMLSACMHACHAYFRLALCISPYVCFSTGQG